MPLYTALINAGQDALAVDSRDRNPEYYMEHGEEIQMPEKNAEEGEDSDTSAHKYVPKVKGSEITESNIRSWIHSKDLHSLEECVWEGCGGLLITQRTTSNKVSKLLETVPHFLNDIRDIHSASVSGDINLLKEKSKQVRREVFNSKDKRGLTPLHKAVGLNRKDVAELLIEIVGSEALNNKEYLGRTPLHYSALVTDSDRSLYDWLVEQGAETDVKDSEGKTPEDYLEETSSPQNLKGKLMEVPEAPRLGQSGRKSPSKRGASPSKMRESSPTKGKGRQPSKQRREERTMTLISPLAVTKSQLEDWAKSGNVNKIETAVLQGHGHLVSNIGKVWNEEARTFVKKVPDLIKQIENVHDLVVKLDTDALSKIEETNLLLSRDKEGVSPILKAAELGNLGMVNMLITRVPQSVKTSDSTGRNVLHWASRCSDPEIRDQMVSLLTSKGADKNAKDLNGNLPHYYVENSFPTESKTKTAILENSIKTEAKLENKVEEKESNGMENKVVEESNDEE